MQDHGCTSKCEDRSGESVVGPRKQGTLMMGRPRSVSGRVRSRVSESSQSSRVSRVSRVSRRMSSGRASAAAPSASAERACVRVLASRNDVRG